jgi:hypothetical protein
MALTKRGGQVLSTQDLLVQCLGLLILVLLQVGGCLWDKTVGLLRIPWLDHQTRWLAIGGQ